MDDIETHTDILEVHPDMKLAHLKRILRKLKSVKQDCETKARHTPALSQPKDSSGDTHSVQLDNTHSLLQPKICLSQQSEPELTYIENGYMGDLAYFSIFLFNGNPTCQLLHLE